MMSQKSDPTAIAQLVSLFRRDAPSWHTKMTQRNFSDEYIHLLLWHWTNDGGTSVAAMLHLGTPESIEQAKETLAENFTRLGWR